MIRRYDFGCLVFCIAAVCLLSGAPGSQAHGQDPSDEEEALPPAAGPWASGAAWAAGREQDLSGARRVPVFLSGKVVLQNGNPPPGSALIESVCNGRVRPEGYTDSKGRFNFQFGQGTQLLPDAGERGEPNRGANDDKTAGCALRASLVGYVSAPVPLDGRSGLENPNIGTIILHRLGNVEGSTVSATSLVAPKNARKAYDRGLSAKKKGKWADARMQFEKAVGHYPHYAAAWFELGLAAETLGDMDGARRAYGQSVDSDSRFVKPYLQLAYISARSQNWPEVADTTSRMLRLDPYNYPGVYYLDSVAQFKLRKVEAAERSARQAVNLDRQNLLPGADYLLGLILTAKGELVDAAGFLRTYLKLAPMAPDAAAARGLLADLEAATAKSAPAVQPPQPVPEATTPRGAQQR